MATEAFPWRYVPARRGLRAPRGNPLFVVDLIVFHCTQGDDASGAASWFQNPAAGGSAHVIVDDDEGIRCIHDNEAAWHAKGGHNYPSFGVEIAGWAHWTEGQWMRREKRIIEAARWAGAAAAKYDISTQLAPVIGGRRRNGLTAHRWCPGNDHTDLGTGFPYDYLFELTRKFARAEDEVDGGEWPPPRGGTLRLALHGDRKYAGWDECLGPMRWIAKHGLKASAKAAIAWSGSKWNDPSEVTFVCQNLVKRADRYARTGEWS